MSCRLIGVNDASSERNTQLLLSSKKGFALMLTLWVLAILGMMVLTLSMMVSANIKASSYLAKDVRAYLLARGAVKRIAVDLYNRENRKKKKALHKKKNLGRPRNGLSIHRTGLFIKGN